MNLGTATVIRGDARRLPLPDKSVDLIVTSPPYFALRSYQDGGEHYANQIGSEATPAEFLEALWACTREWMRVLKPSGSLFVNLGDKYNSAAGPRSGTATRANIGGGTKWYESQRGADHANVPIKSLMGIPWRYAIGCIDELGLILRAEVIWSKSNPLPESVRDRVRRSHETWFHFVLRPQYYSAIDTIREWTGESVSSRKSNGARTAGYGLPGAQVPAMASSGSTDEPCLLIELPTSCGWDQSQAVCNSITCAAIVSASTQHTLKPSPCAKTCSAVLSALQARTQSRPIAVMDMSTTSSTLWSSRPQVNGSVVCACENATADVTGPIENLGRLPGSVWTVPTEPLTVPDHLGVDHFAAFPTEWPRRIIAGWSPVGICVECGDGRRPVAKVIREDRRPSRHNAYGAGNHGLGAHSLDTIPIATITGYACACPAPDAPTRPSVILDPFGGTGTVALVAKALGRHGISVDLSHDYSRLARWRITDPGQLAKVLGIDKPPPQTVGQIDLFGEAS